MLALDSCSNSYTDQAAPVHGAKGEGATSDLRATARERHVRPLAPAQLAIAKLAAEGLSNKEIARIRGITVGAVKLHIKAAMRKLGIGRRQGFIPLFPLRGADPDEPVSFTAREAQVLPLIAEGLTNEEIGARIGIVRATTSYHVRTILEKLGVRNRTEAARWWLSTRVEG